jgi:hypothetical protein
MTLEPVTIVMKLIVVLKLTDREVWGDDRHLGGQALGVMFYHRDRPVFLDALLPKKIMTIPTTHLRRSVGSFPMILIDSYIVVHM